jgi:hypothetical protein
MTIYVLNTPILTDWGMYSFVSWRLEDPPPRGEGAF